MSGEQQQLQARDVDRISTALIDLGVTVVKRNPIPSGLYVIGILLCLLFNGYNPTVDQKTQFNNALQSINFQELDDAGYAVDVANTQYRRSSGWFSCNSQCQIFKSNYEEKRMIYNKLQAEQDRAVSEAKASVGIFSSYGVDEARNMFWSRFAQGKHFATSQSKWDAIFMGIGAMTRNESMVSYALRVLMHMLINFTMGVFISVVTFIFSLYSLLQTYRVGLIAGILFFLCASVAAISFAVTWILGLYAAAAGSVYVGAKVVALNMRIEDGRGGGRRGDNRVRYDYNR